MLQYAVPMRCVPVLILSFNLAVTARAELVQPCVTAGLTIGIESYREFSWGSMVPGAHEAARSFNEAITNPDSGLVNRADGVLLLNNNATVASVWSALNRLRQREDICTLIIYFSGQTTYTRQKFGQAGGQLALRLNGDPDSRVPNEIPVSELIDAKTPTSPRIMLVMDLPRGAPVGTRSDTGGAPLRSCVLANAPIWGSGTKEAELVGDEMGQAVKEQFEKLPPAVQEMMLFEVQMQKSKRITEMTAKGLEGLISRASDTDPRTFTTEIVATLRLSGADLSQDGRISGTEAFVLAYPAVVRESVRLGTGLSPVLAGDCGLALAKARQPSLTIESDDPEWLSLHLSKGDTVRVNETEVTILGSKVDRNVTTLEGSFSGLIQAGINRLHKGQKAWMLWSSGTTASLKKFEQPYHNSYAILVAIEDYARTRDPLHRGPTGFQPLNGMIEQAERLRSTLVGTGFPDSNIIRLYNQHATSQTIESVLKRFWAGGMYSDADRLVFYFGGHGSAVVNPIARRPSDVPHAGRNTGFLVTYDYNRDQPTSTSLLMRDLTTRHFENVRADHVLVALDACHSGLAIHGRLGEEDTPTKPNDPGLTLLTMIRNERESAARNVLVAGEEDQKAIADRGGVFTHALIRALEGYADGNGDGVIQFQELGTYVRNRVAEITAGYGIRQTVGMYQLDGYGTGNIFFVRPPGRTRFEIRSR
jgi:hypothetical protein